MIRTKQFESATVRDGIGREIRCVRCVSESSGSSRNATSRALHVLQEKPPVNRFGPGTTLLVRFRTENRHLAHRTPVLHEILENRTKHFQRGKTLAEQSVLGAIDRANRLPRRLDCRSTRGHPRVRLGLNSRPIGGDADESLTRFAGTLKIEPPRMTRRRLSR